MLVRVANVEVVEPRTVDRRVVDRIDVMTPVEVVRNVVVEGAIVTVLVKLDLEEPVVVNVLVDVIVVVE